MSQASRSKSKDKKAGKGSSKNSGHVNLTTGTPASGYNPISGTFHTFDTAPVPSSNLVQSNGRFKNIDETDDNNGNISANGVEYDSVSNAGSWSGGSEDHKEKPSQPNSKQESVPGADNDKREKMRQKNERKHQRQKEKRAQELHDRCNGYLMSRKLESLAQQLVAMGFTHERATMALILNEGKVEESVACLIEAGDEEHNVDDGGNLKIDISEELARVVEFSVKYKITKLEVERAVVSSEGDLDKAEDILKAQKEEEPPAAPKPEENRDRPTLSNSKAPITISQNPLRVQEKPTPTIMQQRRDEKDFNYAKVQATVGPSLDPGIKSVQMLKTMPPPKPEWPKPQQVALPVERRWPNTGSSQPVSFSLASSPLQVSPPPSKQEPRFAPVTNELKNLQLGSLKEPVFVMQRPQSIITGKQAPTPNLSSSSPNTTMGWYPNSIEQLKPNGFVQPPAVSSSISPNTVNSSNPLYNKTPYQSQQQQFMQPSVSNSVDSQGARGHNGNLWSRGGTSPPLAIVSLGLFSGVQSDPLSQIDWSTGSSVQFDYTNVDWSLNQGSLSSNPSGLSSSSASYSFSSQNNARTAYDSFGYGLSTRSNVVRPVMMANGNGVGLKDGVGASGGGDTVANGSGGAREWTSPFEEKDIFSLPRQFVSSPSL